MRDKNNITFSIIMPCYNSSAYVCDAVNSLISQSNPNWELVAINDGSTDDTLNILQDYEKKDSRIKVYSKENGGYATAINYGLDRIHGVYFLMMGSDDRLASNLFADIADNIGESKPDVIAFRAVKFVNGQKRGLDGITAFDTKASMSDTTISEYAERYPKHSEILFVRDTAKCYRTELLGDLRYFGRYGYDADGIFSTLFVHKCQSFMSVPVNGYLWTLREDSVSAKTNVKIDKDRITNWISYNDRVLLDQQYVPARQELNYLCMAHDLGVKLLANEKKLDFPILRLIHEGRKKSVLAAKRFSIEPFFSKSKLRKAIFIHTPMLWTVIFRVSTRKERKK